MSEFWPALIVLLVVVPISWVMLKPPGWTRPKWLRDLDHREAAFDVMRRWTE